MNANSAFYSLLPLLKNQSVLIAEKNKKIKNTLIRPQTTYGAESWTLHKDVAKSLADFGIKILRILFGGIRVNENWRKRYSEELMQLFGNLD
jgi:hypothetical protein